MISSVTEEVAMVANSLHGWLVCKHSPFTLSAVMKLEKVWHKLETVNFRLQSKSCANFERHNFYCSQVGNHGNLLATKVISNKILVQHFIPLSDQFYTSDCLHFWKTHFSLSTGGCQDITDQIENCKMIVKLNQYYILVLQLCWEVNTINAQIRKASSPQWQH